MSEAKRLREIFAALEDVPKGGALCPPAEKILDSADGRLAAEVNEEVVRHIGECAACSTAWWMARETSDKVEKHQTGKPVLRSWPALAAAAVLVLAFGVVGQRLLQPGQPAEGVYRAQETSWLTSALPADLPLPRDECELRWTSGPPGTTYDITVTDEDLEVLASQSGLAELSYRLEPETLAQLPPGAKILWRVTARLPDGGRQSSKTFSTITE
jgi:hypothetical protein